MLGSVDDAEELVQETYLRAWRSYGGFEGRSSVSTWMYRIATNVCFTALGVPFAECCPPGSEGQATIRPRPRSWPARGQRLQPSPDSLVTRESDDPATIVSARASVRLALIASLQHQPARRGGVDSRARNPTRTTSRRR
jgi:RNA polymerase sigma-70 factor (ECF subfamily)